MFFRLFYSSKKLRNLLKENFLWISRSVKYSVYEDMFDTTYCNIGIDEALFIDSIIKDITSIKLIYRGSKDGWYIKDFRDKCKSFTPTITLFQIKDGDCIGGYTEMGWN